jgi:cell division FtsZ-interacting protein ZapD
MQVGRHKTAVFLTVGALLAVNYWLAVVRPRRMNCAPGEMCHVDSPAMRINRALFWLSLVIFAGAVTFTYAALWWVRMQS